MMLKDDWLAFMKFEFTPSAGHFEALLIENENWKDPGALFSGFPGSSSLSERIDVLVKEFKLSGDYFIPDPERRASKAEMEGLVLQYVAVLADIGEDEGESDDAAAIRAAPINFVDSYDAFSEVMRDHKRRWNELPDLLDDVYLGRLHSTNKKYRFISEAVLELTKSKEVTMWVMADFVGLNVNMRPGYDIFMCGGLTAYPRDETVVCIW